MAGWSGRHSPAHRGSLERSGDRAAEYTRGIEGGLAVGAGLTFSVIMWGTFTTGHVAVVTAVCERAAQPRHGRHVTSDSRVSQSVSQILHP
jgi:hypothetical protein